MIGFNKIETYLIINCWNLNQKKYKYLIGRKYYYKNIAINRVNISFHEFKNLDFSKNKYPFFVCDFKSFYKSIVLSLPLYLQYIILKIIHGLVFHS